MDSIVKFAVLAHKYPKAIDYHTEFSSLKCLDNRKDFAWSHEELKTIWVNESIDVGLINEIPNRVFKKLFKRALIESRVIFYEEHYDLAEKLIKKIKKRRRNKNGDINAY